MSFKNKLFSIIVPVAGVVVLSSAALAQDTKPAAPAAPATPPSVDKPFKGPGRGFAMRGGKMAGRMGPGKRGAGPMSMFRGLNLTDAQKEQMRTILQSNRPDQAAIDQRKAFRASRTPGTPLTDAQKAQMKAFREQGMSKARSVHEQLLNVLTADQKAELKTRHDQMKQRREQFREKREQFRKDRPGRAAPPAPAKPITT